MAPFDPLSDPSSLSQRWKTWKRRFETYLVALNVTEKKQSELSYCTNPAKRLKIFLIRLLKLAMMMTMIPPLPPSIDISHPKNTSILKFLSFVKRNDSQ